MIGDQQCVVAESLSRVQLFATPGAAHQVPMSSTLSQRETIRIVKFVSIESVMLSTLNGVNWHSLRKCTCSWILGFTLAVETGLTNML